MTPQKADHSDSCILWKAMTVKRLPVTPPNVLAQKVAAVCRPVFAVAANDPDLLGIVERTNKLVKDLAVDGKGYELYHETGACAVFQSMLRYRQR